RSRIVTRSRRGARAAPMRSHEWEDHDARTPRRFHQFARRVRRADGAVRAAEHRPGRRAMTFARPPVVGQTEWEAALAAITEREEAVAGAMNELAAARKRMPMVRVEHEYRFEGPDGVRSLPEL